MSELNEQQKEKMYREALATVSSSLSNNDSWEYALSLFGEIRDYKDADELYRKYSEVYAKMLEEQRINKKRRNASAAFQRILVGGIVAVVVGIIVLAVILLTKHFM